MRQREVAAGFWFLVFGFGIFVFVFAAPVVVVSILRFCIAFPASTAASALTPNASAKTAASRLARSSSTSISCFMVILLAWQSNLYCSALETWICLSKS